MPTLDDFDFFVDGPIDRTGFRTYRFPSGRAVDLLPHHSGYAITHGDGRGEFNLTKDQVVARLSELAAAHPAAA